MVAPWLQDMYTTNSTRWQDGAMIAGHVNDGAVIAGHVNDGAIIAGHVLKWWGHDFGSCSLLNNEINNEIE